MRTGKEGDQERRATLSPFCTKKQNIPDIEGALSMKDLSKHFKNEIKTVSNENFSAKIKPLYFLLFVFFFDLSCVYRGIPFFAMLPEFRLVSA